MNGIRIRSQLNVGLLEVINMAPLLIVISITKPQHVIRISFCHYVISFSIKQYITAECLTCEEQFHFTVQNRVFMSKQGNADKELFEVCQFKRILTRILLECYWLII